MNFDWQLLVALGIVLIALAVVARRAVAWARGTTAGCGGGCAKCPSSESPPLVSLDVQPRRGPSQQPSSGAGPTRP